MALLLTFTLALFMIASKKVKKGSGSMTDSQKLLKLAKQNNGVITTAMVVRAGISRGTLKYLSDTGGLEKVQRGVYTLPEV